MRPHLALSCLLALATTAAVAQDGNGKRDPQISAFLLGGYEAAVVYRLAAEYLAVVETDAQTQGSAVAFVSRPGEGTLFATNCHVLKGAKFVRLSSQRRTVPVVFMGGNPDTDACFLYAEELQLATPDMMRAEALQIGEKAFAIGAPKGLPKSISEGIVSGRRGSVINPPTLIQTTAPISPGSSGGGLFDARARLIGITTFQLRDAQNLNFAISVGDLLSALNRSKVETLEELSMYGRRAKPGEVSKE